MKKYGFVYVIANHLEEAKKIAHLCLDKNLIACANIYPSLISCYKWKGKKVEAIEVALFLKTKKDKFKTISSLIKKHHSNSCPAILFIPATQVLPGFAKWMEAQIK